MKAPTKKQCEVLAFISEYSALNGYSPSLREIGEKFNISVPAVHYMVEAMKKKELLEQTTGAKRAISLPEEKREERINVPIPFFSEEPDEEEIKRGCLSTVLIPKSIYRDTSYAFVVTSWSMVSGGIIPGDIAILDNENTPLDGDIVLAHPEGKEGKMELRKLRKTKNYLELWPENDSMGITRSQTMVFCGILREVRRSY